MEALAAEVGPLYERLRANSELVATLGALRDTLLPRLISGKLRVPEARQQVEAALA
jgi:type I restriction enzyme S subunit